MELTKEYNGLTYQLHKQPTLCGKNEIIEDVYSLIKKPKPKKLNNRSLHAEDKTIEIQLVLPSTKPTKTGPLVKWAEEQIAALLKEQGIETKVQYTKTFFDVPNTRVGEQPYYPNGFVGALNRLNYCLEKIRPSAENFHETIILSMESDLSGRVFPKDNNPTEELPYDAPNLMVYVGSTGKTLTARGWGPAAQEDLLEIAQKAGFEDEAQRCGKRTYGNVLAEIFKLDGSNWQKEVCEKDRAELLDDLLAYISKESSFKELLSSVFNSIGKSATPSAPRRPGLG